MGYVMYTWYIQNIKWKVYDDMKSILKIKQENELSIVLEYIQLVGFKVTCTILLFTFNYIYKGMVPYMVP